MTNTSDKCREDAHRLFDGDMTAEELITAWRWLDGIDRRDIPHWTERRDDDE